MQAAMSLSVKDDRTSRRRRRRRSEGQWDKLRSGETAGPSQRLLSGSQAGWQRDTEDRMGGRGKAERGGARLGGGWNGRLATAPQPSVANRRSSRVEFIRLVPSGIIGKDGNNRLAGWLID